MTMFVNFQSAGRVQKNGEPQNENSAPAEDKKPGMSSSIFNGLLVIFY